MATRRPLVAAAGRLSELPVGDVLAGDAMDPFALIDPRINVWLPPGNGTTVPGVYGIAALTVTGTATTRSVATTNAMARMQRLGFVSAATAGSIAGARTAVAQVTTGVPGTPPLGGFRFRCIFGCSDLATVAGARQFVGIGANAAPSNVEPSTLTNCIGVGHGAGDSNLKIYYGGSAAQTPVDLGASFPANTLGVDVYSLELVCAAGANTAVAYTVKRLNTGDVASGTLSAGTPGTQLPANTTLMAPLQAWRTNNATALAVGLDLMAFAFRPGA